MKAIKRVRDCAHLYWLALKQVRWAQQTVNHPIKHALVVSTYRVNQLAYSELKYDWMPPFPALKLSEAR